MFVTLTPHPTKSKSAVTAVAVTNANFFFIYSLPTLLQYVDVVLWKKETRSKKVCTSILRV